MFWSRVISAIKMQTRLALVTGATGCVGANVVEALLERGYDVRALRRATSRLDALAGLNPELVTGDITDYATLPPALAGCDLVFHVAAIAQYWRNAPNPIYHANVTGTRNVLRAALEAGVRRVVLTSSVATLGVPEVPGQLRDERSAFNLRPADFHYGHSKLLAEAEATRALRQGLDVVIVNPATVIGQRDVNFVGGELLRVARRGLLVIAPPGGMGVVAARDVGAAHVLAAERGVTGARYILNGENVTHRALAEMAAEIVGVPKPRWTAPVALVRLLAAMAERGLPLPAELDACRLRLSAHKLYFDGSKARAALGFRPRPARAAIIEAWKWYTD